MLRFEPEEEYSRADVMKQAGRTAEGGHWYTGIVKHDGEFVIFANVGTEGRTGHDYDNRWEVDTLRWFHQTNSHLGWPSVKALLQEDSVVHVFWRTSNADKFKYAGRAQAIEVFDTSPVEIIWPFGSTT
jgi:5-methylcytosine-specific restriction protein A